MAGSSYAGFSSSHYIECFVAHPSCVGITAAKKEQPMDTVLLLARSVSMLTNRLWLERFFFDNFFKQFFLGQQPLILVLTTLLYSATTCQTDWCVYWMVIATGLFGAGVDSMLINGFSVPFLFRIFFWSILFIAPVLPRFLSKSVSSNFSLHICFDALLAAYLTLSIAYEFAFRRLSFAVCK